MPRCNGIEYNIANQICYNNEIFTKCGEGDDEDYYVFNKCDGMEYTPASQICTDGGVVAPAKCGGAGYNPLKQGCCINTIFSYSTQRCKSGIVEAECGNNWYNIANTDLKCENNVLKTKCGSGWYNPATQFCYNSSEVGNFCGSNPQSYDPDIYKCKSGSNGIYLKTPVSYGGKSYEAVLIGTQIWMAENLNYEAEGSKCYGEGGQVATSYNRDYNPITFTTLSDAEIQANCDTYGRLYDWSTAMGGSASSSENPSDVQGVCPSGWHLPSDVEWDILITLVRFPERLMASGWNDGSDFYGFKALPGGIKNDDNFCYANQSYWLSSTEVDASGFYGQVIAGIYGMFIKTYLSKSSLSSVRCVKDE